MVKPGVVKLFKTIMRILGWALVSLLSLLVLLIILIRTPYVQGKIVGEIEAFLEQKLNTKVSVGGAYLNFPKSLEISSLYLEDLKGDTLLYFNSLEVDTDLWALLDNKIQINALHLNRAVGKINKDKSSGNFNYQFIIDAFASNDSIAKPTSQPWQFDIHGINLHSINFEMIDEATGTSLLASLEELEVDIEKLDLDKPSLNINSVNLSGANIDYSLTESSNNTETTQDSSNNAFDIQLGEIAILKSKVHYESLEQSLMANFGQLEILFEQISLPNQSIDVKSLLLENSQVNFSSFSSTAADSTISKTTTPSESNWKVTASSFESVNNDFVIQLDSTEKSNDEFNPTYLNISKLNADIKNSSYSADTIHTEIEALSFLSDQSPIKTEGIFNMGSSSLSLNNGIVQIGESKVNLNVGVQFETIEQLMNPSTQIQLSLAPSNLYFDDLKYFVPSLTETKLPNQLSLEGNINGNLGDLNIAELRACTSSSKLLITVNIRSLSTIENVSFDIQNLQIESTKKEFLPYLSDTLQAQLSLPETIKIKSKGKGNLSSFRGQLLLNSSLGNIALDVDSLYLKDSIPHYDMTMVSKGISIGRILKQKDGNLDSLQFNLKLEGLGIDLSSLKSSAKGSISNIHYNNYTYDSITLDATLQKTILDGNIKVKDENLSLILKGNVDMNADMHKNNVALNLQKADLEAINFSLNPLILKGNLVTDFETRDFKKFNGEIVIRDFSADNDIDVYRVDSLLIASIEQDQLTEISIDSDIMKGVFKGSIDLFTVGEALKQHINRYYDLKDVANDSLPQMDFTFDLDLKNTDLITKIIVPGLQEFEPGHFKAAFNSASNLLEVDLGLKHVKYADIIIDDFKFNSSSSNQKLTSNLTIDHISSSNAQIQNFNIEAILENNELSTSLIIDDSVGQRKYFVKSVIQSVDSAYQLSIDAEKFILAYEPWSVEQIHPLILGNSAKEMSTSLKLSKGEQVINFQTTPKDSTLQIGFSDFSLNTIGAVLNKKDKLLDGQVNGNVNALFHPAGTQFLADIDIDNLTIMAVEWGDFKLNVAPTHNDYYRAKLDLKSPINKVSITSELNLKQTDEINLKADIDKFDLKTIAPIVKGSVKSLEGNIQGKLDLKNGFSTPNINGNLTFDNLSINPAALNNNLKIEKETIKFNDSEISFNKFNLKDEKGNSSVIDGKVKMVDLTFYKLDLSLTTNNFMLLNTTIEDNELFYGVLKTDGKVIIKGTSSRPDITTNLKLLEGSNITYVVPETEYNMLSSENVVEFVNKKGEVLEQEQTPQDSLKFLGLELSAKVEIDKSAIFNVVIDPITQDQLSVQGAATLNLDIDRKGDIQLSGKYTVEQGQYNFSFYKLIKREFDIEKGSTITWTGDPFDAILDIRAFNKVEAPPIDLMINQINNASNADLQKYRQLLPILVYLNIEGILTKPEITFMLDMPQDKQNALGGSVYARLMDLNTRESDLNKQVFALLMLQRFISENPLKSEGGYDVEDKARRSVSRILSDQLNRLTSNIDAVNINFDLQSYQNYGESSSSGTTKLELGISKTLFNDQLEVKVSGNVNLEGEQQQNFSDYIGDLALEYKITDDGRLRITGFRRSDFDVINGEIVETGAGIIYVRDYNTFKELFRKSDEE
ncbi:translocation/assembly module TamB domain-containing protein [Fulvivirga lutimaris]|uniref:translocation/assembly module TamB domain-containing protein n=1 Tax=Fulvivirga lutimaris TaxID=1819566 RepID=UPI0012BD0AC5|nr:translocation/assembly module TamB domain-containing protein [Fulvivirga lutimaris]MTI38821.1 translocation/assembly module TamB [Fulvivirga lutimaris]